MTTLRRILQLTILALIFAVVAGGTMFLIEWWSGGRVQRWMNAPFTGGVGDESLAVELALLPIVLAVLACWGTVRLFRLRSVDNEVEDTFRPVLMIVSGYGRFVLAVVAAYYLVLGHGWAAASHFAIAVFMFIIFYRKHRNRERAATEQLLDDSDSEDDEAPQSSDR
jgi:hypothetical protein